MKNSHTLLIIEEAFQKTQEFNYKRYISELGIKYQNISNKSSSGQKHKVNQILEKIGLHLMYKSVVDELENNLYNKMGKWSSVGTILLALKNPEKFDEAYNILSDEESKSTFDWFIKYRVAYAFLGEIAGEIYPSQISKEEYLRKMNQLKFDRYRSLIMIGGYYLNSGIEETADSWIFEQYRIKGKLEVTQDDYVIDGGAFLGETSFWFISKGAGKVFAFEPDQFNFGILSDNIKRNKMKDKIIPIQEVLSDRNGDVEFLSTGTGSSKTVFKGNESVRSIKLDSFVEEKNLESVDFIKLDVEGAEMDILKGAIETIKRFKPKMAISVYHKPEDIITIPKFILETLPDAKFYLSHKYYSWCDTILFVNPRDNI
jgi:FkbM family methyltransferase